jgi:hypothetical protein
VDALIALKKAGATEAELAVMTAVPSAHGVAQQPQQMAPVSSGTIEVFGAQLLRTTAGDPYLHFQSSRSEIFPDGLESNTAFLVLYKGKLRFSCQQ